MSFAKWKGKHIVLLTVFFVLTAFAAAEMAEAEMVRTMYLKEASFSYMYKNVHYEYVNGIFGEGEKVKIYGKKETGKDGDKKISFYKTRLFGKDAYIPEESLTSKKPKYSYSITYDFETLQFSKPVKVYDAPYFSSGSRVCEDGTIYTLGKSRYWYMAFYEGKPCFIRKDADEIKTVSNSSFPKIEISAELASGKKNIQKRLKFMFSMLPQNVRSIFLEQDLMIRAEKTLSRKEYEERGVSGYALQKGGQYQICLKEEAVPYLIETSFFHEAGHILKYIANRNEEEKLHLSDTWKNEIKNLSLREYYHTEAEYMAEIFELYVKNPGYLLENAPDSFQFVTDVLLPDGSTFSVERTEME